MRAPSVTRGTEAVPSAEAPASTTPAMMTTIDGVVYEIPPSFFKTHPGGSDLLMLAVGRDASILVASYHRRDAVFRAALARLRVVVGEAGARATATHEAWDPHSRVDSDVHSPLYAELHERVNDYFAKSGRESRGGSYMLTKSLVLLAVTAAVWAFSAIGGVWALAPLTGVLFAMLGLCIQHDANHGSLTRSPLLNTVFGFCDDLIGGSALCWRIQHCAGHHLHPNDVTLDADSYSNWPVLRMNPALPLRWYHRYQMFYAPLAYAFVGIIYPIADVVDLVRRHHEHVPMHPLRMRDVAQFVLGKFVHYCATLAVPVALHGWRAGLLGFWLPMQLSGGLFLGLSFAVSHNVPGVAYNVLAPRKHRDGARTSSTGSDKPVNEGSTSTCWAEAQIRTSADWSPTSVFANLLWGGLNTQVAHHLFPGVAHEHYPALTEIIRDVCAKRRIPYTSYPSFASAVKAHLRHIADLSNRSGRE